MSTIAVGRAAPGGDSHLLWGAVIPLWAIDDRIQGRYYPRPARSLGPKGTANHYG